MERLGYSGGEAMRRVRVARLAGQFPQVLDELRSGAIHLTGLFLLSQYIKPENIDTLLLEARGAYLRWRRRIGRGRACLHRRRYAVPARAAFAVAGPRAVHGQRGAPPEDHPGSRAPEPRAAEQ